MTKPIILAICGKSAAGKDSTAHGLSNSLKNLGIKSHIMTSDTTRPPREGEKSGTSYNFIDKETFEQELKRGNYIESTVFRNGYYGTHYSEIYIDSNIINIGVFNLDGLNQLYQYRRDFKIVVFYLDDFWLDRLRRSHSRERRGRLEYFRRLFVDWFHFLNVNKVLKKFRYHFTIQDANGVTRKSRAIISALIRWRLITPGQNSIIQMY